MLFFVSSVIFSVSSVLKRILARFQSEAFGLFYKENHYGADKYEYRGSDAEIGELTAVVPLHICLAQHRHTHKRHIYVACLIPDIKYLQNRKNNYGQT